MNIYNDRDRYYGWCIHTILTAPEPKVDTDNLIDEANIIQLNGKKYLKIIAPIELDDELPEKLADLGERFTSASVKMAAPEEDPNPEDYQIDPEFDPRIARRWGVAYYVPDSDTGTPDVFLVPDDTVIADRDGGTKPPVDVPLNEPKPDLLPPIREETPEQKVERILKEKPDGGK
jgi:hypothetical protein